MSSVVITGANRGIGLEFCRAYVQAGDKVAGFCRKASRELETSGAEVIAGVDVCDPVSLARAAEALHGRAVDILVCNAGILSEESLDDLDFSRIQAQWEVNALGPLRSVAALLKNLHRGSKIALITSRMGSIGDNDSGGYYGYRMSKAALNAAGKSLAIDLAPRGISVGVFHPGYVKTAMTGYEGNVAPSKSAADLVARIADLDDSNTGGFRHANGETLPW